MVLHAAERELEQTIVVHCGGEFAPLYARQPLYPGIQAFLNEQQFEPIDLVMPAGIMVSSAVPAPPGTGRCGPMRCFSSSPAILKPSWRRR